MKNKKLPHFLREAYVFNGCLTKKLLKEIERDCEGQLDDVLIAVIDKLCEPEEAWSFKQYFRNLPNLLQNSPVFPSNRHSLALALTYLSTKSWAKDAVCTRVRALISSDSLPAEPPIDLPVDVVRQWNTLLFNVVRSEVSFTNDVPVDRFLRNVLTLLVPRKNALRILMESCVFDFASYQKQLQVLKRACDDNLLASDAKEAPPSTELLTILLPPEKVERIVCDLRNTREQISDWETTGGLVCEALRKIGVNVPEESLRNSKLADVKLAELKPETIWGKAIASYFPDFAPRRPILRPLEQMLMRKDPPLVWPLTFDELRSEAMRRVNQTLGDGANLRQAHVFVSTYAVDDPKTVRIIREAIGLSEHHEHFDDGPQKGILTKLSDPSCTVGDARLALTQLGISLSDTKSVGAAALVAANVLQKEEQLLSFLIQGLTLPGFDLFHTTCENDAVLATVAAVSVPSALRAFKGLEKIKSEVTANQIASHCYALDLEGVASLVSLIPYAQKLLQKVQLEFHQKSALSEIRELLSTATVTFRVHESELFDDTAGHAAESALQQIGHYFVKRHVVVVAGQVELRDWEAYLIRDDAKELANLKRLVDAVVFVGKEICRATRSQVHWLLDVEELQRSPVGFWWKNGELKWSAKLPVSDQITSSLERAGVDIRRQAEQLKSTIRTELSDLNLLQLIPCTAVKQIAQACKQGQASGPALEYLARVIGCDQGTVRKAIERMATCRERPLPNSPWQRCSNLLSALMTEKETSAKVPPTVAEVASFNPENWWPIVLEATGARRPISYYELCLPTGNDAADLEAFDALIARAQSHWSPKSLQAGNLHFVVVADAKSTAIGLWGERITMLCAANFRHELTLIVSHASPLRHFCSHLAPYVPPMSVSSGGQSECVSRFAKSNFVIHGAPRSGKSFTLRERLKLPSKCYNMMSISEPQTFGEMFEAVRNASASLEKEHISIELDPQAPAKMSCVALTILLFRFVADARFFTEAVPETFTVSLESSQKFVKDTMVERLGVSVDASGIKTAQDRKCDNIMSLYLKTCPSALDLDLGLFQKSAELLSRKDPTAVLGRADFEASRTNTTERRTWTLPYIVTVGQSGKLVVATFAAKADLPPMKWDCLSMPIVDLHGAHSPEHLRELVQTIVGELPRKLVLTHPGVELMLRLRTEWLARCDPSIIVGPTGCGKTFHISCLARAMDWNLMALHMTPLTPLWNTKVANVRSLAEHLKEVVDTAEKSTKPVVCFLDEINTFSLVSVVRLLVLDGAFPRRSTKCNLAERLQKCLADLRVVFVAAANPYSLSKNGRPVYAVHEHVPASLSALAVSTAEPQRICLSQIAAQMSGVSLGNLPIDHDALGNMVADEWAKSAEDEANKFSLRTISNFLSAAKHLRTVAEGLKELHISADDHTKLSKYALAMAWAIFFAVPCNKNVPADFDHEWQRVVELIQGYVFTEGQQAGMDVIARTELKTLSAVVLLSIFAKIPLIVVGPPGTSKSLIVSMVVKTCVSERFQQNFSALPLLSPHYFQCSNTTSASSLADRVRRVCEVNNAKRNGVVACACIDELSLAPASVLRVVNKGIDEGGISLVATSNFGVDAALVNRCVLIRRAPLQSSPADLSELTVTVMGTHVKTHADAIARTLLHEVKPDTEFQRNQSLAAALRHVGCRDWFAFISNKVPSSASQRSIDELIVRDFGFGVRYLVAAKGAQNPLIQSFGATSADNETEKWSWSEIESAHLRRRLTVRQERRRPLLIQSDSFSEALSFVRSSLVGSKAPITFVFGDVLSPSPSASSEQMMTLKRSMEAGHAVVLIGVEHLAEALLDVLNSQYAVLGGRRVARVSVDGAWDLWTVHERFTIIFIQLPRLFESDSRLLSSAFFDRFERRSLSVPKSSEDDSDNRRRRVADKLRYALKNTTSAKEAQQMSQWMDALIDAVAEEPQEYLFGYHESYLDSMAASEESALHRGPQQDVLCLLHATKALAHLTSDGLVEAVREMSRARDINLSASQHKYCVVTKCPAYVRESPLSAIRDALGISTFNFFTVSHQETDDAIHQIIASESDLPNVILYDACGSQHATALSYNLFGLLELLSDLGPKTVVLVDISRLSAITNYELEFHPCYKFVVREDLFLQPEGLLKDFPSRIQTPRWALKYTSACDWSKLLCGNEVDIVEIFKDASPVDCAGLRRELEKELTRMLEKNADSCPYLSVYARLIKSYAIERRNEIIREVLNPTNISLMAKSPPPSGDNEALALTSKIRDAIRSDNSHPFPGLLPSVGNRHAFFRREETDGNVARHASLWPGVLGKTRRMLPLRKPSDIRPLWLKKVSVGTSTVEYIDGSQCRHTLSGDGFPLSARTSWMFLSAMARVLPSKTASPGSTQWCTTLAHGTPFEKNLPPHEWLKNCYGRLEKTVKVLQQTKGSPSQDEAQRKRNSAWEEMVAWPGGEGKRGVRGSVRLSYTFKDSIPKLCVGIRALLPFYGVDPLGLEDSKSFVTLRPSFVEKWHLSALPDEYKATLTAALRCVPEFNSQMLRTLNIPSAYSLMLAHLEVLCADHNQCLSSVREMFKHYRLFLKEQAAQPHYTDDAPIAASIVDDLTPLFDATLLQFVDPVPRIDAKGTPHIADIFMWGAVTAGAKPVDPSVFRIGAFGTGALIQYPPRKLSERAAFMFPKPQTIENHFKSLRKAKPSRVALTDSGSSGSTKRMPLWMCSPFPPSFLSQNADSMEAFLIDVRWNFAAITSMITVVAANEEELRDAPLSKFLNDRLPRCSFGPCSPSLLVKHLGAVMELSADIKIDSLDEQTTVGQFASFYLNHRGLSEEGIPHGYADVRDWFDEPICFVKRAAAQSDKASTQRATKCMQDFAQKLANIEFDDDELVRMAFIARSKPDTPLARLQLESSRLSDSWSPKAISTCVVCSVTSEFTSSLCGCDHVLCRNCALSPMKISGSNVCDKCPRDGLHGALRMAVDTKVIAPSFYFEYVTRVERAALQNSNVYFQCPNATHAPFYGKLDGSSTIFCPECECLRCADGTCGRLWHPKVPCTVAAQLAAQPADFFQSRLQMREAADTKRYEETKALYEGEMERLKVCLKEFLASEATLAGSRYCPNPLCKRLISKIDGCDSMVCGRDTHGTSLYGGCGHHFNWNSALLYAPSNGQYYLDQMKLLVNPDSLNLKTPSGRKCVGCETEMAVGMEVTCVNCEEPDFYCLKCVASGAQCLRDDNGTHMFSLVNEDGTVVGSNRPDDEQKLEITLNPDEIIKSCPRSTCRRPNVWSADLGCLEVTCPCGTRYYMCCLRIYGDPAHTKDPECDAQQRKYYKMDRFD